MNIITDNSAIPNYFIRQSSKFNGIVDVKWFGAMGDGINDDTDAIQSALDFVSFTQNPIPWNDASFGGGTVFLPKGVFLIFKTLLLGTNCKLIGVNNRYHFQYLKDKNSGGSIIKAGLSLLNNWVISSATYENWIPPTPPAPPALNLLPFNEALKKGGDPNVEPLVYNNYIYRMGISIENLTIDGGENIAFGGIRLANAGNSMIRNVGCFNTKCAFMLNTCWGGSIENCFSIARWYGALAIECNSTLISNCYFAGIEDQLNEQIPETELPNFIYQGEGHDDYSKWGLNYDVKFGKNGIYSFNTYGIQIQATVTEYFHNGYVIFNSLANINAAYIEGVMYHGLVAGVEKCQIVINQIVVINPNFCYYFGKDLVAEINGHSSIIGGSNPDILYVPDESTGRNITFSKTIYKNRTYQKDISFVDEGAEGQNFGAVYVNPDSGNDLNYGFNENDPVETFDAALIRVQNQSTINPIKTIYIRAAPQIGEGIDPWYGAAIKNLDIVSIENADVLIKTYDIDLNVYPQRIKGRIYFKGENSGANLAGIGQVELLGNVKLYFRNIDLVCNTPQAMPVIPTNMSLFGLKNAFGKITFNNDSMFLILPPTHYDIDLDNIHYHLVQANLDSTIFPSPKSLLEVKFLNISINSGALSPIQNGNQNLAIDCIQINSLRNGTGWQDAEIISNNF